MGNPQTGPNPPNAFDENKTIEGMARTGALLCGAMQEF
jgi:hypothetical protein